MNSKLDRRILFVALASAFAVPALSGPISPPAAAASLPKGPMKLQKLTVVGNKQVSSEAIAQGMTVHVGQKVTQDDLTQNFNALIDVYRKANVGAGFKQKMTMRPGQVSVTYMIEEKAAPPPAAPAVLRVDQVVLQGNKKVSTDKLMSVITMKPGDPVTNEKVSENLKAILEVYKKADVGVKIQPDASYPQPNHAIVSYKIEEQN